MSSSQLMLEKLWEKYRSEEIKKLVSTKEEATGNEEKGRMAWGISPKNDYKCDKCGAYAHQGESLIHFKTLNGKCKGTFKLMQFW